MSLLSENAELVSIITPFLDAEEFIAEAIESVLSQSCAGWELLLVDDGSTDGSADIALHYQRSHPGKIRYLNHRNHQNRGISASRNLGLRNAKGEYIASLDADDVLFDSQLEQQAHLDDLGQGNEPS